MNLIAKKSEFYGFVNELTREMDKYIESGNFGCETYICWKTGNQYTMRYPGATRGHIEVDENEVIVDIVIYEIAIEKEMGIGCYSPQVREITNKYIGKKMIFEN